ncbi:MAG: 5-formyltetrahydrofolate cyclo-ligase [Candidatus Algichlamydia australiensis]|nr:5-formyltetrahydrofolate cyclo-ligase [Chlamydiales bacterium]
MEDPKTVEELKESLRLFLKEKRSKVTKKHRNWAREDLLNELVPVLKLFPAVLSFANTEEEIDLSPLNEILAKEKRLLLPRVEEGQIVPYFVTDLENGLKFSKWKVREPDPTRCQKANLEKVHCVLVPGLGFDSLKHRLGYGKGCYDKLLQKLPQTPAFGLGFKEQLISDHLPTGPHDRRLTRLYLY